MLRKLKNITINFGPQHPAAHGVLRLVVEIRGETIEKIAVHIGLLHRGTEKLIESKFYKQALPYMDRLDYVSTMAQEHCYCLGIESLMYIKVPGKASIIRMIFCEITRILNHLLALTTHALDVGALTPFLWGFDQREELMEFYERVCGARLHAAYIIPGGVNFDISESLLNDLLQFCKRFYKRLDEFDELLTYNRVWKERLANIGTVTLVKGKDYAFSGVALRGSGAFWDLRFLDNYELYRNYTNMLIPYGMRGDSFDRFLVRLQEMRVSTNLIEHFIWDFLFFKLKHKNLDSKIVTNNSKLCKPKRGFLKSDMESLINHFMLFSQGYPVSLNESYRVVEAPKGEFAIGLSSDNSAKPSRCSIKAPGFLHIQGLSFMSEGFLISDLVTIIGTLDLVFGEIDR